MNIAYADIRWLLPEEGGRATPLDVGTTYYPHILIDNCGWDSGWSTRFVVTPTVDGKSKIEFTLLADGPEADCFFSKFYVGMKFFFTEGRRPVAIGTITKLECLKGQG